MADVGRRSYKTALYSDYLLDSELGLNSPEHPSVTVWERGPSQEIFGRVRFLGAGRRSRRAAEAESLP